MALDFNSTTQRLILKTEYSLEVTDLYIKKMAFAGVTYDSLILSFDPSLVGEYEYQYYYENGLDYIFDIVTI